MASAVAPAAVIVAAGAVFGVYHLVGGLLDEREPVRLAFNRTTSVDATLGDGAVEEQALAARRPTSEIPWGPAEANDLEESPSPQPSPSPLPVPRLGAPQEVQSPPSPLPTPKRRNEPSARTPIKAGDGAVDQTPGELLHRGRIGEGSTISQRLGKHGLTAQQIAEIVKSLEGMFDFRRCRPEHRYEVAIARRSGKVERFRYLVSETRIFEASRRGEGLEGRRVKVPVSSRWIRVGGKVGKSLSRSITAAGLNRQVLNAFLNTFGRDMSFRSSQRENDTFRVIVEEEVLRGKVVGTKAIWAIEYAGKGRTRRRAFFYESAEGQGSYFDDQGFSFDRSKLITPCNYRRVSSPFNLRRMHPVLKRRVPHRGVDFAAKRGTPIVATADGTVQFVGRKGANGNLIILNHEGGLDSIYAHLQKFARGLKRGQEVRQGKLIGYVGSTGRSTGPHLHFGLRLKGRFLDPQKYRSGPGRPIDRRYRAKFGGHARKLARELSAIPIR